MNDKENTCTSQQQYNERKKKRYIYTDETFMHALICNTILYCEFVFNEMNRTSEANVQTISIRFEIEEIIKFVNGFFFCIIHSIAQFSNTRIH